MLRWLTLIPLLLTAHLGIAQAPPPAAADVLRPVYNKARKEGKNVLLIFHASWCGWCRKMDASLQDTAVKPLIDGNYVTTHLTVHETPARKALENPGALELLNNNGGKDQGLPYWVILDPNGKALADARRNGENTGCPAAPAEVAHLVAVLQQTSSLKPAQLQVIEKRFRQNE